MLPTISVVMSIYNESLSEIEQAIDSILIQDYDDYECIIVIDNPNRYDAIACIEKKKDSRFIIVTNEKNIGLAMSMNRAVAVSKGKYLLRMDADDICLPSRFRKQIDCIERNDFDLVCSNFRYIDEKGIIQNIKTNVIDDVTLKNSLPYGNFIHHPTVVMKKSVFNSVGGYRDFPCAQDYDLWLRLYEKNISIHFMRDVLLYYRIRSTSVSQSNKVKQLLTIWYIQDLYKQRKRNGVDFFSIENYEQYLFQNYAYDKLYCNKAQNDKVIKDRIDYLRCKKYFFLERIILIIKLIIFSRFYRKYYFHLVRNKIGMIKVKLTYSKLA